LAFLAPQFVLQYLGQKIEEEGWKTKVVKWRNPKMQELKDQEVGYRR
jgi:hypothetical protein